MYCLYREHNGEHKGPPRRSGEPLYLNQSGPALRARRQSRELGYRLKVCDQGLDPGGHYHGANGVLRSWRARRKPTLQDNPSSATETRVTAVTVTHFGLDLSNRVTLQFWWHAELYQIRSSLSRQRRQRAAHVAAISASARSSIGSRSLLATPTGHVSWTTSGPTNAMTQAKRVSPQQFVADLATPRRRSVNEKGGPREPPSDLLSAVDPGHGTGSQHRGIALTLVSSFNDRLGYYLASAGIREARRDREFSANCVVDSTHQSEIVGFEYT